ncbi:unnamed protein product, partial [Nesidiocoris tenuis]
MCGIPERTRPRSWLPFLARNLCSPSSVILSELSKSRATRFLVTPCSIQAFKTWESRKNQIQQ